RVVQGAVRRERRRAGRVRRSVERRKAAPGLLDDQLNGGNVPALERRVDGDVRGALRDEHVHPEVAEAALHPCPRRELEERLAEPEPRERPGARVAEGRVLDAADPGDAYSASVRKGACAAGRPPAMAERRRGRDGRRDLALSLE